MKQRDQLLAEPLRGRQRETAVVGQLSQQVLREDFPDRILVEGRLLVERTPVRLRRGDAFGLEGLEEPVPADAAEFVALLGDEWGPVRLQLRRLIVLRA